MAKPKGPKAMGKARPSCSGREESDHPQDNSASARALSGRRPVRTSSTPSLRPGLALRPATLRTAFPSLGLGVLPHPGTGAKDTGRRWVVGLEGSPQGCWQGPQRC